MGDGAERRDAVSEYSQAEIDALIQTMEKRRPLLLEAMFDENDTVYRLAMTVQHQEVRLQALERTIAALEQRLNAQETDGR